MDLTDRAWRRVRHYIAANQTVPARAALESLLTRDPEDTAAHLILGGLLAADGHLQLATREALAAARNPPGDPNLLGDLIAALLKVGEVLSARALLDLPAVSASRSPRVLMRAASQRQLIGEHAAALGLIERAAASGASGREFHFYHAVQLAFNGRLDAAAAELERCIAIDPPLGRAYVQLARMRQQTPASNHLDAIAAALERAPAGTDDRAALEFARYKELEDLGRFDEAWQALVRANGHAAAARSHDEVAEATRLAQLLELAQPDWLARSASAHVVGPQPIFVVGMPRSGTTVLERLLGNHSMVASAGELGDFPRSLAQATDHSPEVVLDEVVVARLRHVDWDGVRQMYLAQTQWRAHDKPYYVDKLPRNWMVAGLIHKAFPEAKIINLVRAPMDVCFSNWRAYFGPGAEFAYAYALESLAAHYRQYQRVMAHWHRAMPGVILDVDYAHLVRQPENAAREVMAFCGLGYEPGCTDLARNTEPSATLSMAQVRQPIHAHAFREWAPYADQLAGFRRTLTAA